MGEYTDPSFVPVAGLARVAISGRDKHGDRKHLGEVYFDEESLFFAACETIKGDQGAFDFVRTSLTFLERDVLEILWKQATDVALFNTRLALALREELDWIEEDMVRVDLVLEDPDDEDNLSRWATDEVFGWQGASITLSLGGVVVATYPDLGGGMLICSGRAADLNKSKGFGDGDPGAYKTGDFLPYEIGAVGTALVGLAGALDMDIEMTLKLVQVLSQNAHDNETGQAELFLPAPPADNLVRIRVMDRDKKASEWRTDSLDLSDCRSFQDIVDETVDWALDHEPDNRLITVIIESRQDREWLVKLDVDLDSPHV